ncbi:MAG: urease accessory protein UreE [Rhodoferax sp.]|nr:urease accessory protein UreE [Rhodoferax sp.]
MLTANKLVPHGRGLAAVLLKRATSIELDWDVRQKSRFDATDSAGRAIGVFLPRGTVVRGDDVLVVEDGSLVRVVAAPQPVLRITHCSEHGTPFDLVRAAYHLGNRHVPIELQPDHLKIEPDHVLADMLRAMHLIVHADTLAFEPENGAYSSQGHAHGHTHDHAHQAAPHEHGAPAVTAEVEPHGHDHGHEHPHDHAHDGHDRNHQHRHDDGHDHAADATQAHDQPHASPGKGGTH